MDDVVRFFVPGRPAPKGSWKFVRGKAVPSSKYLLKWQAGVTWVAQSEWTGLPEDVPVAYGLCAKFYLEPPGRVAKKWPFATKDPDLDKLLRGVVDALMDVVYVDDNQLVEVQASKQFAKTPNDMGAELAIWRLNDRLRLQDL